MLQGNLAQTPLHDFLQFLSMGKKSGQLEIVSGRRAGLIDLKAGKIERSFYRGLEGLEAIFLLLDLSVGDFEFHEQKDGADIAHLDLEVVDLLMVWMNRKTQNND